MPSTNIQAKADKNKKCKNPAITEHKSELSVASNPAKSNISAKQRDMHRLRWIVVLSPRNPKKMKNIEYVTIWCKVLRRYTCLKEID